MLKANSRFALTLPGYAQNMWLRKAMYRWLIPAAFVLPLWLLLGWSLFGESGWAFLWVVFVGMPSVLIAQLVLALLVRARPSVVQTKTLSWADVAGFGTWHTLTVLVGLYAETWFGIALVAAIAAALGLFWLSWRQFRAELGQNGTFIQVRQVWRSNVADRDAKQRPVNPNPVDPSQITIVTDPPQDDSRQRDQDR